MPPTVTVDAGPSVERGAGHGSPAVPGAPDSAEGRTPAGMRPSATYERCPWHERYVPYGSCAPYESCVPYETYARYEPCAPCKSAVPYECCAP